MVSDLTLWGLFASAFISATLFAGGSEVVLFLPERYPLDRPRKRAQQRAVTCCGAGAARCCSWLPLVGDPLCFAAGCLRMPRAPSGAFIAAGKAAR
jgi:membrane protein YqaA with SNARE-associated domain